MNLPKVLREIQPRTTRDQNRHYFSIELCVKKRRIPWYQPS